MQKVNDVKVLTPTLAELKRSQSKSEIGDFYITLPKYQRGVVWSDKQRTELVHSLYSGFPVGSLLGFKTGKTELTGASPGK